MVCAEWGFKAIIPGFKFQRCTTYHRHDLEAFYFFINQTTSVQLEATRPVFLKGGHTKACCDHGPTDKERYKLTENTGRT